MMDLKRGFFGLLLGSFATYVFAGGGNQAVLNTLLLLAALLLAAKLFGALSVKVGLPSVIGELLSGVFLGNLLWLGLPYGEFFAVAVHDPIIGFISEFGVLILLFLVGLETSLKDLCRAGVPSISVAIVGVVAPFAMGYFLLGPWLLPGLSNAAYLFVGASLTATSIAITGRIFSDFSVLSWAEARLVLGAAVIDDVLGLLILAVVSSIALTGTVGVSEIAAISAQAFLFLVGAVLGGHLVVRFVMPLLAKLDRKAEMEIVALVAFALLMSWLASYFGLAGIIGAFIAGLVVESAYLKSFQDDAAIRDVAEFSTTLAKEQRSVLDGILTHHRGHRSAYQIEVFGAVLVPIFFVVTGMQVNLEYLLDLQILWLSLVMTFFALVGKVVSGFFAFGSTEKVNPWLVGWGMAPRGEVGIVFAVAGKSLGVVSDSLYTVLILVMLLTTLLTPSILSACVSSQRKRIQAAEAEKSA